MGGVDRRLVDGKRETPGAHVDDRVRLFADGLRRTRLAAGLSLSELARRVHYSKGYLSKVETGAKPASIDFARRCDAAPDADGELAALLTQPDTPDPGSRDE